MEKQKFQLGDVVYKISEFEAVEPPYIEKAKVVGVRLKEDEKMVYDVLFSQEENKRFYFTNKPQVVLLTD